MHPGAEAPDFLARAPSVPARLRGDHPLPGQSVAPSGSASRQGSRSAGVARRRSTRSIASAPSGTWRRFAATRGAVRSGRASLDAPQGLLARV